jgi:hypothetical protein
MGLKRPLFVLVALSVFLTLLTGLPWFSSQIMPDVFTGPVILTIFMLGFAWERLGAGERWLLVIGLTTMLSFHPSFPPLTILVTSFVLTVSLLRRVPRRQILRILAVLLGPVVLAFLAMGIYSEALIHRATILPEGPTLILARVIADGPGRAYLRESCGQGSHYELCPYVDELPTDVSDFLFSAESPWKRVTQKLGIEGSRIEASSIVMNAIRRYPLWQMEQSSINFVRQLMMFRGIELPLCYASENTEGFNSCLDQYKITQIVSTYFPNELMEFRSSLQNGRRFPLNIIYIGDVVIVIISTIFCVSVSYRWWGPGGYPEPLVSDLLAVIFVGILSNAALTGILAPPQDRYGARVIWLLPFFAFLYFAWSNDVKGHLALRPRR